MKSDLVGVFNPSEKLCSSSWIVSSGMGENKKPFETTTQRMVVNVQIMISDLQLIHPHIESHISNPDLHKPNTVLISVEHMGVSKNKGTPKWMVKIMENPIKMG